MLKGLVCRSRFFVVVVKIQSKTIRRPLYILKVQCDGLELRLGVIEALCLCFVQGVCFYCRFVFTFASDTGAFELYLS